jgi:Transposase
MPNTRYRDMLPILEEDTYGFWTDFSRRPGGESGVDGRAVWWCSSVPFITYNGVAGVAADLDATLARVRGWGVPARWTVSSASTPDGYDAALADHGLTLYDEWPGMVAVILNYFKTKKVISSGIVEGLNNKAKVTMRNSYGFRTFRVTELALYHLLGKLHEPELLHRFYSRVGKGISREWRTNIVGRRHHGQKHDVALLALPGYSAGDSSCPACVTSIPLVAGRRGAYIARALRRVLRVIARSFARSVAFRLAAQNAFMRCDTACRFARVQLCVVRRGAGCVRRDFRIGGCTTCRSRKRSKVPISAAISAIRRAAPSCASSSIVTPPPLVVVSRLENSGDAPSSAVGVEG